MSRVQYKTIIISDDDDDDYELPSLSERIASTKPQYNVKYYLSDSENEDTEFQKFSERIRSTPYSQVKFNPKVTSENKSRETKFLRFAEKTHTSHLSMKLDFSSTSDSENEESVLSNFSERAQNPPLSQLMKSYEANKSASDGTFSNIAERLCKISTPKTENKENCFMLSESDSDEASKLAERMHEFYTPRLENRGNYCEVDETSSDESFSNFAEKLRTPLSVKKMNYNKKNESDSDDSFLNFAEKLRTPLSVKKMNYNKKNEADSDDSFLNSTGKLHAVCTPKSQKKGRKDSFLLPQILENKRQCHSKEAFLKEDTSNSIQVTENEKEFNASFPLKVINLTFLQNREEYTRKLFEFFNRKIFSSQLPEDMPLTWDSALTTTAGLTCCSYKNNVYSCSIKLSPELLCSFDRLKDTLLHEMCHAAVWVINKKCKVRHGPLWQIWASRCKLILPFVECPQRCHTYEISYRVWYCCTKCNWKKGRCKRVRKLENAVCKKCKTPIIMMYA